MSIAVYDRQTTTTTTTRTISTRRTISNITTTSSTSRSMSKVSALVVHHFDDDYLHINGTFIMMIVYYGYCLLLYFVHIHDVCWLYIFLVHTNSRKRAQIQTLITYYINQYTIYYVCTIHILNIIK